MIRELTELSNRELQSYAHELFKRDIEPNLTLKPGSYSIAIDLNSGDFEIVDRASSLSELRQRQPGARIYILHYCNETKEKLGWQATFGDLSPLNSNPSSN